MHGIFSSVLFLLFFVKGKSKTTGIAGGLRKPLKGGYKISAPFK
jgi:hypothetical protein